MLQEQYYRVLLGGGSILYSIANASLRVDWLRNQYHRVLLGGHTILHSIANGAPRVESFRNQYHQVCKMTGKRAHHLHDIANTSSSVATGITSYAELLLGGSTICMA